MIIIFVYNSKCARITLIKVSNKGGLNFQNISRTKVFFFLIYKFYQNLLRYMHKIRNIRMIFYIFYSNFSLDDCMEMKFLRIYNGSNLKIFQGLCLQTPTGGLTVPSRPISYTAYGSAKIRYL